MEGFKKIIKMKTGGSVNNVYEAKKSSGDKDNIQKTKAIKAGPAAAPSKAAVKGKDVGAKTVGPSGHKDPYIKSKESGKTPNAPSAAVKGRNKKATGTVNKFKTGGNVKKMAEGGALEQAALLNALPGKVNEIERARMAAGWPYNKSHAESSRLEYRCRHHPDELHDALIAEGWA